MMRGIYTSVSGLTAADKRQQVLASSIANSNTPGYKSDDVTTESFDQLFAALYQPTPGTGAQSAGRRFDLSQGGIQQTGGPLDLALDGPGFFVLNGPDGPLFTRAGRFSHDAQGVLRSPDGLAVQGEDGNPITAAGTTVRILEDGTVLNDGAPAGRLRLVTLDPEQMTRAGTTTFTATAAPATATPRVVSGALENSNVDVTAVMTSMTLLLRAFEAGRQAVQLQNDTVGATVNQVGSLR